MISWRTSGNDSQLIVRNLLLGLMCRGGSLLFWVGAAEIIFRPRSLRIICPLWVLQTMHMLKCFAWNSSAALLPRQSINFPHAFWPGACRVMALPLSIT